MAAAPALALSGSRFLRPKLSRCFSQVAQARPRISDSAKGSAALIPPLPSTFASRFYSKPRTPPAKPAAIPQTASHSRFLPRKMLSQFFNHAAHARPRKSRFKDGTAALQVPMPDIFASRFFTPPARRHPPQTTKPLTPPRHPRPLRPHWPHGKPRGPAR